MCLIESQCHYIYYIYARVFTRHNKPEGPFRLIQTKKKFYDTELENLERQQKQQIEKMEQDHALRRREETKRIRAEQERDLVKFQEQLKQKKKEVEGDNRPYCYRMKSYD